MRSTLAVFAAVLAAVFIVFVIQDSLLTIDPWGLSSVEPSRAMMFVLLFGDLLGAFVAGLISALMVKRGNLQPVWITLILLTLARFVTVFFMRNNAIQMVSVLAVFGIPFSVLLGGRIVQRARNKPEDHHTHHHSTESRAEEPWKGPADDDSDPPSSEAQDPETKD